MLVETLAPENWHCGDCVNHCRCRCCRHCCATFRVSLVVVAQSFGATCLIIFCVSCHVLYILILCSVESTVSCYVVFYLESASNVDHLCLLVDIVNDTDIVTFCVCVVCSVG